MIAKRRFGRVSGRRQAAGMPAPVQRGV